MGNPGVGTNEAVQHSNESPRNDDGHQSRATGTRATAGSARNGAQDLTARIKSLSESLRNSLPTSLIPEDLADVFRHDSNQRLQLAREQGVELQEIYMGTDCLPTWRTLYWDPEHESLHGIIQKRLVQLQLAQELGELLQQQIRDKSTQRLRQALALGIKLEHIVIGESLLPEWTTTTNGGGGCRESPRFAADDTLSGSPRVGTTSEGSDAVVGSITDLLDANAMRPSHSEDPVLRRALASSSILDSDDGSDDEDAEEIYMNNHVDAQPVYDEYGHSNIVHDVEIVGGHCQSHSVDLEVYMAVDDDDVEDLPEVELAIDRKAFELHFGHQDAVDVHIPDMEIFCFDKIEEYDHDEEGDEGMHQDNSNSNSNQQDSSALGSPRHMDLGDDDGHNEDDQVASENAIDSCQSSSGWSDSETHSEEE